MSVTTQGRSGALGVPDPAHVRALPKVELHVHVEGAARAATVADLAARNGVDLGVDDPADLYRYRDLTDFLRVFDLVCRALVDEDDIRRVTYEALGIAADAGVRYREMFFSPAFLMRHGVAFATIWHGLEAGVRDARADFGIACRLIMDVDKPSGPAAAMELLELAEPCDRDVLVGIGGDAGEMGVDLAGFAGPFGHARARGWRTTMHLGEEGPADDIRIGIDVVGVERIDHGVSLVHDPVLMAEVAARRIPLTCCPTSNVAIGIVPDVAGHPIAALRDAGVLVTVSSDNAEMFGVDAADEVHAVASAFGWGLDEVEDLCLSGIDACWAPVDEQRRLRAEFEAEMHRLRTAAGLPGRFAVDHGAAGGAST
jgi:adenosine deaminase